MYPDIEHMFFSTTPNSDVFLTKEEPTEDISIKPAFQFQNHFLESVPNCSHSPTNSDLVDLESSTRLENPLSKPNKSQINPTNSSQSHSPAQNEEKKAGAEGYEVAGRLLSKENCQLKVEEQEEAEEEEEEEEDGFRTPSSLDHRIAEAKQCPPAPRKPKPSLKRKAPDTHTSTLLFLPEQFQILFPVQHNPHSDSHRISKKVRRDDTK